MRNIATFLLAAGAFCAVSPLGAQQPSGPPKVLRVFREDIKEGKGAAHEKTEAAFMQAVARAGYPAHVLGMTAMTGPAQAWFLEGHDTFDSITTSQATLNKPEFDTLDAADAELRSGSRSRMTRVFSSRDLSFGVDKTDLPKMRFFTIETIRVREGQAQEFAELAKMLIGAAEKVGDDPVPRRRAPGGKSARAQRHVSVAAAADGVSEVHGRRPAAPAGVLLTRRWAARAGMKPIPPPQFPRRLSPIQNRFLFAIVTPKMSGRGQE